MNKHTPGPWGIANRHDLLGNPCGINVYQESENGGIVVCRMPDGATVGGGKSWPDDLANARLIAAAPDLLAALEDAEFIMRKVAINPGNAWPMLDSLRRSAEDARAAIAKARGES